MVKCGIASITRNIVSPLEIKQIRSRCEVAAVAESRLLVERIGGLQGLEVSGIEGAIDSNHLDAYGVTDRGEGFAITKDQCHIACSLALRGERVAIHRSIGVAHGAEILHSFYFRLTGIHDVCSRLGRVFFEGFDRCGEDVDGGAPLGVIRIRIDYQTLKSVFVGIAEHIEEDIVFPRWRVHELPRQDEAALSAQSGIEVKTILQMGLGALEICFSLERGCLERDRESAQSDGGVVDEHLFGSCRIVQGHAGVRGSHIGDGLLVEHPCAGLSSHGGQAVFRQGQRLARSQRGHIGRPGRTIDDGLWGACDGVSRVGRCRAVGRGDGS